MSNKSMGNQFERELCRKLFDKGFWVHNFAQKNEGQPADIIAVRNGIAYLIDAKHCEGNYFSKSRIEENQRCAMALWEECGNTTGLFAVKLRGTIYMVRADELRCATQKLNLDEAWFIDHAETLDRWAR